MAMDAASAARRRAKVKRESPRVYLRQSASQRRGRSRAQPRAVIDPTLTEWRVLDRRQVDVHVGKVPGGRHSAWSLARNSWKAS